jgi:hypothetical protein
MRSQLLPKHRKTMKVSKKEYYLFDISLDHYGKKCEKPCKGLTYQGLKLVIETR